LRVPRRDAIPFGVTRLLPFLRRRARLLAALAALALLLPTLLPRNAAAAPTLTLVICTSDGLVSLPLDGDGGEAQHVECAACLRHDLAALPPPAAPPLAAPASAAVAKAAPPPPALHHAAPHQRPPARAPPSLS